MYINNQGHMTKLAAMPIYGINPSKIFFSGTGGPISKKTWHEASMTRVPYYNLCINHDPVMTLTYFNARSTWVAYVFEWVNC